MLKIVLLIKNVLHVLTERKAIEGIIELEKSNLLLHNDCVNSNAIIELHELSNTNQD